LRKHGGMSLFPDATAQDRLPVSLITGFLGSGKTTLLNHLLRHPAMANTAIVINEFGDVALDQHFIERSDGEIVVMANGCLCCTVQGDLEGVVGQLYGKRDRGEVPSFDRLVIETTGLADPAPIMQLLLAKPLIVDHFALDAVIATVDALHGARQLREHREAVNQAALADRIVVTKTDLADAGIVAALEHEIAAINPGADIFRFPQADFSPSRLFDAALIDRQRRIRDLDAWLGIDDAAHPHDHLHDIDTFSLVLSEPVAWRPFAAWLTRIKIRHGDHLLRVKGIVSIAGEDGKIAIHGVHHIFHPPTRLPRRQDDDRASRIVFITKEQVRAAIEAEWCAHAPDLPPLAATVFSGVSST
jgi:G3E family GTPase